MGIADDYKKASQIISGDIVPVYPVSYFPQITEEDYRREYFIRYFVKLKTNKHSSIIEVKEPDYKKYSSKAFSSGSFFYTVALRWKLTGNRSEVMISNTNTTENKELFMPTISIRLSNRLQFWRSV